VPPPFSVHAGDDPGTDLGTWDDSGNITIPGTLTVAGDVVASQFTTVLSNSAIAELLDRLDSVESAQLALSSKVTFGATASRPSPVQGIVYFDTTLGYPIWGTGTAWVKSDGTALTGNGASNAPTVLTADVNSDNTITLSWTAPAGGADTYTIYETNALTGVPGAMAITTTTSIRAPATLRTYEYWVTATLAGVESAISNKVQATLPYVSPTGVATTVATMGKTTDGTSSTNSSTDKTAVSSTTATASGTLVSGHARAWLSATGSGTTKLVVYANSSGAPGALLASSDAVALTHTAEATVSYPFTGNQQIAITSGTTYWVGLTWQDPGTPGVTLSRDNTGSGRQESSSYTPSPFGTPSPQNGPVDVWVDIVTTGVAPGGGPVGDPLATPASVLGLGSIATGRYSIDIGRPDKNEVVTVARVEGGFAEPKYFYVTSDFTGVVFREHMDGQTTQPPTPTGGTHYARTELKEFKRDGVTRMVFDPTVGTHTYEWVWAVPHIAPNKPWVTLGQVHYDTKSDVVSFKLKPVSGTTRSNMKYVATLNDVDVATLMTGYDATAGGEGGVHVRTKMVVRDGGLVDVYIDNVRVLTGQTWFTPSNVQEKRMYFKVGAYGQTHHDWGGFELATEYTDVILYSLASTHVPAI
jgi:hypothetical protein